MSDRAGKYYDRYMNAIYELPSADGKKMVKCTLTHARKFGMLFSVSRVLEELANHQIVQWSKEQVARAAVEYPYDRASKSEDDIKAYVGLLLAKGDEFKNVAADRGTEIHAGVNKWLEGKPVDRSDPAIDLCITQMEERFSELGPESITTEYAIGGPKFGCVGTPDIVCNMAGTGPKIIDVKTVDLSKFKTPYDKWFLQLGAYRWFTGEIPGTEIWQCVIDRSSGEVRFIKHDNEERWTDCFKALLDVTCLLNGYDPRKYT